jgi:hypothetical protein
MTDAAALTAPRLRERLERFAVLPIDAAGRNRAASIGSMRRGALIRRCC